MLNLFTYRCAHCGRSEERVFTDTHTRMSLCLECIGAVWQYVTNSPDSEGDNLVKQLDALAPQET